MKLGQVEGKITPVTEVLQWNKRTKIKDIFGIA